jgi:hypothetical protein
MTRRVAPVAVFFAVTSAPTGALPRSVAFADWAKAGAMLSVKQLAKAQVSNLRVGRMLRGLRFFMTSPLPGYAN